MRPPPVAAGHPYGQRLREDRREERHRVLDDLEHVKPRLRAVADHVVQTTKPLADVVAEVLELVGERPAHPADTPVAARTEA